MKRKLFFLLTAAVLLVCTACSGSFIDPGMLDQLGGGGIDLGDDDDLWGGGGGGGGNSKMPTPKNVKATAESSSSIKITWNEVEGSVYYSVYRSTSSSGTYEKISGWVFSESYTDTGLSPNTSYYYKVSAFTYSGEGALSSSVSAKTKAASSGGGGGGTTSKPATPTGVTASAQSSSSIRISWSSVSGATDYNVYRRTGTSGIYSNVTNTSSTSYLDTGLSASTTYYYKVAANNSNGESAQSSSASATTSTTSGGGGTPSDSATILNANSWSSGNLNNSSSEAWFQFNVSSGTTYYIYIDDFDSEDLSYQTYADVKFDARYGSKTGTLFIDGSDLSSGEYKQFIANQTTTVFMKIYLFPETTHFGYYRVAYRTIQSRPQ